MFKFLLLSVVVSYAAACSNFYMNFTSHKLSGRNMDLGAMSNWTMTSWPLHAEDHGETPKLASWSPKFGVVGITGNWFGDDKYGFPSLFADSLNEKGLSCAMQALTLTQYEERSDTKENVFAGLFCFYASQNFDNVYDLQKALDNVAIWGPDALAQHFVVHDASGASLVIECVGGQKNVYLDTNNGENGTLVSLIQRLCFSSSNFLPISPCLLSY
jgi:penicillin V acylase-like amidase (Ntn superfamily)